MKKHKLLHVLCLLCFLTLLQSCGMGAKSALGLSGVIPGASSSVFIDIEGQVED